MKLAVLFPGIGYHCDKPILYFARELAKQVGYDEVINLSYICKADNIRGNDKKMREVGEILYVQAESQLEHVDWQQYEEVLFISKSIGTAVAAAYAMRHRIPCKNIWYTPLSQTFDFAPREGIAFTGTADPWVESTAAITDRCQKAGMPRHRFRYMNMRMQIIHLKLGMRWRICGFLKM